MAVVRYLVLVERDEAGYSALIPDFPGAGSSGNTLEEALERTEDNLAAHVEGRLREKLEIPPPRSLETLKLDSDLALDWAADPIVAAVAMRADPKGSGRVLLVLN